MMRLLTVSIALTAIISGLACTDPDVANGDFDRDIGVDTDASGTDTGGRDGGTGSTDDTGSDNDAGSNDDTAPDTGTDSDASSNDEPGEESEIDEGPLNDTELELFESINDFRDEEGLEPVPLSYSLTIVARTHVQDLIDHGSEVLSGECNMHSWSDHGDWTPCCYTPDHAQAQCMWDKPGELTNYPGPGFEISSGTSSPQGALDSWKSSPGHRAVILNEDQWADYNWRAMGIGIGGGYAHVWFGTAEDPDDF